MRRPVTLAIAACAMLGSNTAPVHAQAHDLHYCHEKFERAMHAIDFVNAKLHQALKADDPKMAQALLSMAQPHLVKLKARLGECRELVRDTCAQCELTLTSAK